MPPYEITSVALKLLTEVSEKIGMAKASFLIDASPKLRKQNQIRTIHASLKIEGNTLSEEQITAIIDNKRVIGPEADIREVENAIHTYQSIHKFKAHSLNSFLSAHKMLMQGLKKSAGMFRTKGVGVVKGTKVQHLAPPAERVPYLMKELFGYLKNQNELALIKSCVFHYELEFIHPFMDGNGRIGRLWQTVILLEKYPIFLHVPFENLIAEQQSDYYHVLSQCDKEGKSTAFIEYMLGIINETLSSLIDSSKGIKLSQDQRIDHFAKLNIDPFTRQDYMEVFKNLSTASASRDLKKGLELGKFSKEGHKRNTIYHIQ